MQTNIFHLVQKSVGGKLQHNVGLDGRPTGLPGVTAVVVRKGKMRWCLLADHPQNPGVSVTNGAATYAEAVCNVLSCSLDDIVWFELDSTGSIDQIELLGVQVSFAPLKEAGYAPRSLGSFLARAGSLFGGIPPEAEAAIREAHARFR